MSNLDILKSPKESAQFAYRTPKESENAIDLLHLIKVVCIAVWSTQIILEQLVGWHICGSNRQSRLLRVEVLSKIFRNFNCHLIAIPRSKVDYTGGVSKNTRCRNRIDLLKASITRGLSVRFGFPPCQSRKSRTIMLPFLTGG